LRARSYPPASPRETNTLPKSAIPALFVVLWSTGFIGAGYAMPWAEPFSFLSVRFGLVVIILVAIAIATGAPRMAAREAILSAVAGMLMHGIYLGGVFWAVHQGLGAGLSALIVGLQPVLTALLAGAFLGEAVLARHWLGLAAGFAGVVIVILPKLAESLDGVSGPTLAAACLAVAAMSAGTVMQKRFAAGGDLLVGTAWQYAGATVLLALGSMAFETRAFVLTGELIFAMVWLVFVLSIGAIFLLLAMIRDGAVTRVSTLFYLVPATTALMAWVLFEEALTWTQVGGMAISAFGVALATGVIGPRGGQGPTRARASK
jgi:drug/metabolite transporter (DMT)-like permease